MFDWENLRYFLEVAKAGTLTGAARTLKVDHVTVGRRVSALETALGARLLDRLPHGWTLTAVGKRVVELASQMEESSFAIERVAQVEQSPLKGNVVVSAPPVLVNNFLAKFARTFHEHCPGITFSLLGRIDNVSLNQREADIAIRLGRSTATNNIARKLGAIEFGLFAARDYIEKRSPAGWGFIASDPQFEAVPQQKWLREVAAGRPTICRVGDIMGQYAAACAGVGLAVLPCFLPRQDDGLVRLDVKAKPLFRELWMVVHKDLRQSPLVRAAMDLLIEAIKQTPALQAADTGPVVSDEQALP